MITKPTANPTNNPRIHRHRLLSDLGAPAVKMTVLAAATILVSLSAFAGGMNEKKTRRVLIHYADMALAKYSDSLETAKELRAKVDVFLRKPSAKGLKNAREAWLEARVPYQQTEVFRFGNAVVDDWEGRVNAWPLDEGLIDYVAGEYGSESEENDLYAANVIANRSIRINGKKVDAATIDEKFIAETLHEAEGIEANVATGYHAIEFLLWGQDLNGTLAGAGDRSHADYDLKKCANGNCGRRAEYLRAASNLLVSDLEEMVTNWKSNGAARVNLLETENLKSSVAAIFTGMGSLSYGELAGERMKLGLLLNDPEEEHDCFSDNTHNSHYFDALGIQNVYLGVYRRIDGSTLEGPSVSDLVATANQALDAKLKKDLENTMTAMEAMVERAEKVEAYDQMIGEGNAAGRDAVQRAIDGLTTQTKSIEEAVAALSLDVIELESSDSLDNPNAVFE